MSSCHDNKEIDFKRNGPDLNVVKVSIIYIAYIVLKHACVVCLRNKISCALRQGRGRPALWCLGRALQQYKSSTV